MNNENSISFMTRNQDDGIAKLRGKPPRGGGRRDDDARGERYGPPEMQGPPRPEPV